MALVKVTHSIGGTHGTRPLLSINAISKGFGERTVIQNLSFGVGSGEIIGVFGDRGSGKSNIICLLSGEIAPTSGHIWFAGEDVTQMPPEMRVRRGLARSAPLGLLFGDLTAAENVLIHGVQHHLPLFPRQGGKTYVEEAEGLLDLVGLGKCAGHRLDSLSPSKQCQVAMAIGLASKPQLLLVDAASLSGAGATAELTASLARLSDRGMSVLFTSATLSPVMEICDRIVVLHDGEIVAKGVPNRIVAEPAIAAACRHYLQ